MTLSGCAEPILDRDIPRGIETAELVFHRTSWFECAVAVYRLEDGFAEKVRTRGLAALPAADEHYAWKRTPAEPNVYDMSVEAGNRASTQQCLEGSESYSDLFAQYVYGEGGFYAEIGPGGTNIIAPAEGLLFIGGFQ